MNSRTKALIFVIFIWLISQVADWVLNRWLDANVNPQNLSTVLTYLKLFLFYLTSGFSLGFVLGAVLFSVWDWPVVGIWIRKQRELLRNKDADEALARECEEISQYLYEQASLIELERNEIHWQRTVVGTPEEAMQQHKQRWLDARTVEAREEERIRRQIGHRVQSAFVKIRSRGIKMDLWGFSLSSSDLALSSYFFVELANALRAGTYLEREFKAGRSGTGAPARM